MLSASATTLSPLLRWRLTSNGVSPSSLTQAKYTIERNRSSRDEISVLTSSGDRRLRTIHMIILFTSTLGEQMVAVQLFSRTGCRRLCSPILFPFRVLPGKICLDEFLEVLSAKRVTCNWPLSIICSNDGAICLH